MLRNSKISQQTKLFQLCHHKVILTTQVEDIMQTLKLAFEAAFQHSSKAHLCELCPMHQLKKVAEEIHS